MLLEDDELAVVEPKKAGGIGWWTRSIMTKEKGCCEVDL